MISLSRFGLDVDVEIWSSDLGHMWITVYVAQQLFIIILVKYLVISYAPQS